MKRLKSSEGAPDSGSESKEDSAASPKDEVIRYGISAAPGIVIGRAHVVDSEDLSVPHTRIPSDMVEAEIESFNSALARTRL